VLLKHPSLWGALLLGIAASALALSCEMSTGLLTSSERSSLYTFNIASSSIPAVGDGAVLAPGSLLDVSVTRRSGASALAVLDLSLNKADGTSASALRFVSGSVDSSKAKPTEASLKRVSRVEGKLEGFAIPFDQAPGLYSLQVAVSGAEGTVLQQETVSLFVYAAAPVIESVSVYPPAVEPGGPALLGLSVSWKQLGDDAAQTGDPWIRWSRNGTAFAEGPLSGGFAKAVWTAPRSEGAYSVRVEVFPSAPAKGESYAFKSAASQDIRVMVIGAAGVSGNDFSDPLAFYSLLKLDGSFEDSGTRPRTEEPRSFGAPSLDIFPAGFGYRFDSASGVSVPGLMPPVVSGKLASFAVLVRLAPDSGDGSIVRFVSEDSSYALSLGLEGGKPYVESRDSGAVRRSLAPTAIPSGPLTLEAILKPEGDALTVSWRVEGERVDAPSIPLPTAPSAGSARLGGEGSLAGVYDGFGMMRPGASSYPSPAFRLAARRQWKSALLIAESFEDGVLPDGSKTSGSVVLSSRGLALKGSGSSIDLAPAFAPGSGLAVEVGLTGDLKSFLVDFKDSSGKRALAVRGSGEVIDPDGEALGSLPARDASLAFSIEQRDGKLCAVGRGGSPVYLLPGPVGRYTLSLARDGGDAQTIVDRVLVRSSSSPSR
jgi:hypothetical protein